MSLVPHRDIVWDAQAIDADLGISIDLALSDDYNGFAFYSDSTTQVISGIVPTRSGRPIWISYTGTEALRIVHDSAGAFAENRILCPGGQELRLQDKDAVCLWYSTHDKRWRVIGERPIGWDFSTAFPASPYDGMPFYRTDLREEFRYDSANSLWVGQRTHTYNFGQSGTLSSGAVRVMRGPGNTPHGGPDRGYQIPAGWDEARIINFGAAWSTNNTVSWTVRRNNVTLLTVSATATNNCEDIDIFEAFTSGGRLQVAVLFNAGTIANATAWVDLVRVFDVSN